VKMWKFVWWSANRDKICQVVRMSEKVENRALIYYYALDVEV